MVIPGVMMRNVEAGVLGIRELVQRLPGNEHRHDDRLARSGRHLEGHPGQAGVGLIVRLAKLVLNPGVAVLFGDLGDVDGRLQGLNLTEEELPLAFRLGPIFEELARRRCYAEISTVAPQADALADAVAELVLLDAVLRPFGVELTLLAAFLVGLSDGDKVRAYPPLFDDVVRNALFVEAEVPQRLVEGRV